MKDGLRFPTYTRAREKSLSQESCSILLGVHKLHARGHSVTRKRTSVLVLPLSFLRARRFAFHSIDRKRLDR